MGFFIPETMKNMNNWLVWKKEYIDGKARKQPYNLKNGRKGGHTSPDKWVSYEEAVTALQHHDYNGLGFGLREQDNLTFIDIDHCITEYGELSELAEEVLELFPDTFTEASQSETGLHIICRGIVPAGFNNQQKGLEMYSGGRYVAITGNVWTIAEPSEHQNEINMLFEKYCTKTQASNTPPEAYNSFVTADNEEVDKYIDKILKSRQGARFALLHNGEWQQVINKKQGACFTNQSDAEQAYINIVNFYTGGNETLTEAIYRRSKLFDRKKNRSRIDYLLPRMISNAKATALKGNRNNDEYNYRELTHSTAKDIPKDNRFKRF